MSNGNNRGYYFMQHGWQDHPLFEHEPYSKRDAWCWLIGNACFKECKANVAGKIITLGRGQLSYSLNFLASRWKWERTKVRRFLACLKTATMIATDDATGQNIITICNYEKYQNRKISDATASAPSNDTEAPQIRIKDNTSSKEAAEDLETKFWRIGVEYLAASGMTEAKARTFLGGLKKKYNDIAKIFDALMAAQKERAVEPKAYIVGCLQQKQPKQQSLADLSC